MRDAARVEKPCDVSAPADQIAPQTEQPALTSVSYGEPLPEGSVPIKPGDKSQTELSAEGLVQEVEARNPTLQALVAAWQAAAERYPQAISLEDPMFMAMVAPASFDSDLVDPGYTLQASQKFPWFGKRAIRGQQAQAGANAAQFDLEEGRLRLSAITRAAYYDYYLAYRQLELNGQNSDVIRQLQKTAKTRYEANQVTQQDMLQAELELAAVERRGIELERMQKVARVRINTLLRQDPFSELPPPQKQLAPPSDSFDQLALQQLALSQRPDLAALSARVRAEQAAVALACKDYYPDTEVFGRYDAMWQETPLRPAVGVNVNVPIYRGRLDAALQEKRFSLSQRRAELEQRMLDVQYEVASAYEQVDESRRMLKLYDARLIPAAEQNVAAARGNYDVSKTSFFELASAQRQLISLREEREQALTNYHTRLAELQRAIGGFSSPADGADEIPPQNK
jgi:cobalt-zinc-cadmium efflux system outer membrane protein